MGADGVGFCRIGVDGVGFCRVSANGVGFCRGCADGVVVGFCWLDADEVEFPSMNS